MNQTQTMCNFAVPPMERIRVGFVGIGERGTTAVFRVSGIPGTETAALADLRRDQCERAKAWLEERGRPGAKRVYGGEEESWKAVCDDPDVDVVYVTAPAPLHPRIVLYALRAGKHVLTEVPGAQTLDEAWEIVETCEKARRHCMMLENCCYGEMEMLAWNLAHKGLLGTLVHAEGGYIHNLVWRQLEDNFRNRANFGGGTVHGFGNTYPTHALGPICLYMDVNRGDRMQSVVSMSSLAAANREFAEATYPPDSWQRRTEWLTGDMNTSVIRTARGRTIMMQYSTASPRPYSRINLVQGTIALQLARSYTSMSSGRPLRRHQTQRRSMMKSMPPWPPSFAASSPVVRHSGCMCSFRAFSNAAPSIHSASSPGFCASARRGG